METGVDLSEAQAGEVTIGEVVGGDATHVHYHGLEPGQLLTHIAEAQAKERQHRRLEASTQDRRHDETAAHLARIDRVLERVALVLAFEASVLGLLLIAALILLGLLLSPHLLGAAAALLGAGLFRLLAEGTFS